MSESERLKLNKIRAWLAKEADVEGCLLRLSQDTGVPYTTLYRVAHKHHIKPREYTIDFLARFYRANERRLKVLREATSDFYALRDRERRKLKKEVFIAIK